MTQQSPGSVRLVASDGALVDDVSTGGGSVDLTIEEVAVGHVVCSAVGAGAAADRVYTVLGEEALQVAARSLLAAGDHAFVVRLHLDPPEASSVTGPIEAVASAVRLGPRATTASVTLSSGGAVIGRGGLVTFRTGSRDGTAPRIRAI